MNNASAVLSFFLRHFRYHTAFSGFCRLQAFAMIGGGKLGTRLNALVEVFALIESFFSYLFQ